MKNDMAFMPDLGPICRSGCLILTSKMFYDDHKILQSISTKCVG